MTGTTSSFLLREGRIIDPASGKDEIGNLLIQDGKIAALLPVVDQAELPRDVEIIDCSDRIIGPGLVDMFVGVGEPGDEHRETIDTASTAAAAGGVTSIVTTPNTNPVADDPAIIDYILRRARDKARVHVYPAAAITQGLQGLQMTEVGLLQEAGAVMFSQAPNSISNAQVLRNILTYSRDFSALISHQTQDKDLTGKGVMHEGEMATRLGLPGIPAVAETVVLARDLRLVELTRGRYHAPCISSQESLEVIERFRAKNLPFTIGVSVNNISLNENDIGAYRTFFRLTPPLRSEEDRLALVEGLKSGLIDVVTSSHDPQHVETKRHPFQDATPGAVGLETWLSAMLRLVQADAIDYLTLFRCCSLKPAELLGIPAGSLKVGEPADIIVIDPHVPWKLTTDSLHSRSKNTPFENDQFIGRVERTFVSGRQIFLKK